ncbi:fumarate reductase flavoprotein subunit [Salmonella enterica subsp. enterica]|uniref:Fumarate reductase flavoprotein subunit n=1 Tax=Salmonella enterica I TaxID=59201 RepID=A0A3S4HT03_SALET|nr:fumarate reductase flavoprotein subunit [Salmonella enterica subsp. enterica]
MLQLLAAQANPNAKIALISKVYPMRSHTVAAEGGSAAVAQDHDSFDYHFSRYGSRRRLAV